MNERFAVAGLSFVTLLSLWLAPWAALARPTGARSSVLLLPNRYLDFSGRTELIPVAGLGTVLALSVAALVVVLVAALLNNVRFRSVLWLVGGLLLVVTTVWGLGQVRSAVRTVRLDLVTSAITRALADPRPAIDEPALRAVLEDAPAASIDTTVLKSRKAGFTIKRLGYDGSGLGLAAFLAYLTGGLALFFGLRVVPRFNRTVERTLTLVAVPLTSIVLALLVAAVVILALQSTPTGSDFVIDSWQTALAGRLETLWYANLTLFSNSLGTVGGLAESLKFATPLIFTGLAVAFGFQAGLFNIGAPGQMVLGAIFAMLVGLYLPGPKLVVLPLAVAASALGGGLWGAIPGYLKARFGANEVINTILMNYIASSLLLFVLSSNNVFAAPVLQVIYWLGILAVVLIVLSLVPPLRRWGARAPRITAAVLALVALGGGVYAWSLAANEPPVTLRLPFKAPGSEPKSYPLQQTARLAQLPTVLGVDREVTTGEAILPLNIALVVGAAVFVLAFFLVRRRKLWQRLLLAVAAGVLAYGVAALFGLSSVDTIIPPTKLNVSFLIALAAAVFMQVFMWRTKWGYELRAVGLAPLAAEYGGASIARNTVLALALSGAFAGLTASHYVLGGALEEYSLRQALPTNDGFDGIAVALLGGNTPLGVVLSAFLFGVLKNGGTLLNITFSDLTRDVVSMILALVVLFIAAKGFLPGSITNPLRRMTLADPTVTQPLDPPGQPVRSSQNVDV